MNLQELQQHIIANKIQDLYVFTGEEIAIQKIYINKIAEISNLAIEYVDTYQELVTRLAGNDLFGTKKLYIVIDDSELLKQESVWNEINTNGNKIILKYNSLDKRSKFYKHFESILIEFTKLSVDVLTSYIQKEIPLKVANCKKLIEICNGNYNQILLELDKIKNFEDARFQDSYDQIFEVLDELGAFHKETTDIAFDYVDSILTRNRKQAIELHTEIQQIGESTLKLIGLLYSNIKTVLLIQCCKSNDICKTTGLAYYQVKYNQNKTGYYADGELVRAMKILQKIESGIKRGTIEEQFALDYFIVNVL